LPAETLPALQQNATPCNIWQSIVPGEDPKSLQHQELSPRQMAAIILLLQGSSDADVGDRLGVSRQTVFRWRTRGRAFKQEFNARRRGLFQQGTDRLAAMVSPALKILERQLAVAEAAGDSRAATHVAATVLRLALRHPPGEASKSADASQKPRRPSFESALDAYINAPLPGEGQGRLR
jgi:hypothetical protein